MEHLKKLESWQCRWSPTLGALESTHQEIWGTDEYTDLERPTVFFGVYGLPDFMAVRQHKGRKAILWAGSDILNLKNGYWVDEKGEMRVDPKPICEYLNKYVENYCENEVEYKLLKELGVESKVVPSFLGDVSKFEVSFKPGNKVYTSVSGDDFERYGWYKIMPLARENPHIEFHLYGNTREPFRASKMIYDIRPKNVIIHGRVPKEQMNAEIKEMQGPLRLTEFDGFSEIIAKGLLMGQWPVSLIRYPYTLLIESLGVIPDLNKPNLKGREWLIESVNKYPWAK